MINLLIAYYLAESLRALPFISRLAGLVKVLETDRFSKDKNGADRRVHRFPISLESEPSTCTTSGRQYPDLVPDQSERLIVYFEDGNARSVDGRAKWQSTLRLVAWGNSALFEAGDSPKAAIPAMIMNAIGNTLRTAKESGRGPIQNLSVTITGVPDSNTNLFARYTYEQTRSQFLFPPYFAFGIDLTVTYTLQHDCLDTLTYLTPAEC
ncbi:hypothetical protein DYU11_11510 [Fibrisoma montanum]|uniref:Uncharacterized protein n=1 Tax=Fibrisoma montanum TaxID=2305895 RepID=A0A418MB53_9BACT|nr:hypothetical protein [Fibrisoma montanum]RIV23601.1 hypothetical protein DYU11_11510 [Fibrisoma montanum]